MLGLLIIMHFIEKNVYTNMPDTHIQINNGINLPSNSNSRSNVPSMLL